MAAPNASAWAVSYAYDVMKRLTNITSPVGSFGYGYVPNPSQLVRKLTLPSSAYITNDYDNVSRQLFTKLVKSDNSILNFHHYDYNPGNQRTNQARVNLVSTNGPAYLATNSVAYGYDAIGQSQTLHRPGGYSGGVRWRGGFCISQAQHVAEEDARPHFVAQQ